MKCWKTDNPRVPGLGSLCLEGSVRSSQGGVGTSVPEEGEKGRSLVVFPKEFYGYVMVSVEVPCLVHILFPFVRDRYLPTNHYDQCQSVRSCFRLSWPIYLPNQNDYKRCLTER